MKKTLDKKIEELAEKCGHYIDDDGGIELHKRDIRKALKKLAIWLKTNPHPKG